MPRLPLLALIFVLAFIPAVVLSQSPETKDVPPAASPTTAAPSGELAEAESLITKSDWKSAQLKLAQWLGSHPSDARALFDAGYVADSLNQLDDAAAFYHRAVEADPQSFEAHLSLGLLLARENKLDEARPELAIATNLDPGEAGPALKARAWRAMAQIDRTTNPSDASNDLLEALKLTPETLEDTLLAAELAAAAGDFDTSEAAYRRILAKDPKSLAATTGLAHVLIERQNYPAAETMLRSALQQSPGDPALTAQLATVLVAEDKDEALPLLQKLHEAHPTDPAITRMLAEVLTEAGDAAASDKLYVALLAAHPDDPALLVAHAQNLTRQLNYPQALSTFTRATELAPTNPDAWAGLAFAASKTGQPAITLHALSMRSKYLPDVPSTYFLWATSYDMLHKKQEAISYYHHFLEAAAGKFPDQEWQARQRLTVLEKK